MALHYVEHFSSPVLSYTNVFQRFHNINVCDACLTQKRHSRATCTQQARKTVSWCMWGLSATVVSGAGGYWYLSYVYLSWDIMVRGPSTGIAVHMLFAWRLCVLCSGRLLYIAYAALCFVGV